MAIERALTEFTEFSPIYTVVHDNKIYVFEDGYNNQLGRTYMYDIPSDTWTDLNSSNDRLLLRRSGGGSYNIRDNIVYFVTCGSGSTVGQYNTIFCTFNLSTYEFKSIGYYQNHILSAGSMVGDIIYAFGWREQGSGGTTYNCRIEFNVNANSGSVYDTSSADPDQLWDSVYSVYDGESNIYVASAPSGRWNSAAFSYNISNQSISTISYPPSSILSQGYHNGKILFPAYDYLLNYDKESNVWLTEFELSFNNGNNSSFWSNKYYYYSNNTFYVLEIDPDNSLSITNASPHSSFINELTDNQFSWQIVNGLNEPFSQKSALIQWRDGAVGTINEIPVNSSNQFVVIPANTLPNTATLQWRVMATGTNEAETPWTDWFTLTTIDTPHGPPFGLQPTDGTKINGTQARTFSWVVNVTTAASHQSAFEIEYSLDGASWTSLTGKIASTVNSYEVPANTFETGSLYWRVRTWNSDDDVGEWSDAALVRIVAAPKPPAIYRVTTGTNRPTVGWTTNEEQTAWQIQALRGPVIAYDSGPQPGGDKEHKLNRYLPNRQYTFRARIQNELGIWSAEESDEDWGSNYLVSINTSTRLNPILTGEAIENAARLRFELGVKN